MRAYLQHRQRHQGLSYMDQAPIQEVDLAQSLENALALLHPQLEQMKVLRDYDPAMPPVTGYGGELSQSVDGAHRECNRRHEWRGHSESDDPIERRNGVCGDLG